MLGISPFPFLSTRTGQALYSSAKHRMPGGTRLVGKRPEQYLPENWPAYYCWAKGAHQHATVDPYPRAVDEVFAFLRSCLDRSDVLSALRGPVAQSGFARLT